MTSLSLMNVELVQPFCSEFEAWRLPISTISLPVLLLTCTYSLFDMEDL
jgi:hypothetical protein